VLRAPQVLNLSHALSTWHSLVLILKTQSFDRKCVLIVIVYYSTLVC
jgi:hypothetical protein